MQAHTSKKRRMPSHWISEDRTFSDKEGEKGIDRYTKNDIEDNGLKEENAVNVQQRRGPQFPNRPTGIGVCKRDFLSPERHPRDVIPYNQDMVVNGGIEVVHSANQYECTNGPHASDTILRTPDPELPSVDRPANTEASPVPLSQGVEASRNVKLERESKNVSFPSTESIEAQATPRSQRRGAAAAPAVTAAVRLTGQGGAPMSPPSETGYGAIRVEDLRCPGGTTCDSIHESICRTPAGLSTAVRTACHFWRMVVDQAQGKSKVSPVFDHVPRLHDLCMKWGAVPLCLAIGYGNMRTSDVGTVLEAFALAHRTPYMGDDYDGAYIGGPTIVNYVGSLLTYRQKKYQQPSDTDAMCMEALQGTKWKLKGAHPFLKRIWEAVNVRVKIFQEDQGLGKEKASLKADILDLKDFERVQMLTDEKMRQARENKDVRTFIIHLTEGMVQELLYYGGSRALAEIVNIRVSDFTVFPDGKYYYFNGHGEYFYELTPSCSGKYTIGSNTNTNEHLKDRQRCLVTGQRFTHLFNILMSHRPRGAVDRLFLKAARDSNRKTLTFDEDSPPWFTCQPLGKTSSRIKCIGHYAEELGIQGHFSNTSVRHLVQTKLTLGKVPTALTTIVVGHMSAKGHIYVKPEGRHSADNTIINNAIYMEGMRSPVIRELVALILAGQGSWDSLQGNKRILNMNKSKSGFPATWRSFSASRTNSQHVHQNQQTVAVPSSPFHTVAPPNWLEACSDDEDLELSYRSKGVGSSTPSARSNDLFSQLGSPPAFTRLGPEEEDHNVSPSWGTAIARRDGLGWNNRVAPCGPEVALTVCPSCRYYVALSYPHSTAHTCPRCGGMI
ncbi:unnamed protein product [Choristocarpus tenellus]